MVTCPICNKDVPQIVIPVDRKILGCRGCVYPDGAAPRAAYNVNLGQTVDKYTRKDGSVGKITTGKAWEMENRRTTPDGVVVNKVTGKPAEY